MKIVLAILLFTALPIIFSCDTSTKHHPYVYITVNISQVVDQAHKLYVVFHFANNWVSPWLTLSYDTKSIVIPPLNVGKIPLYFEIIYDFVGNSPPATATNWYQGWYRKTDRTDPLQLLDPFVIPDVPVMLLNVDMDDHGIF
jgi:hypothetical protein